MKSIESDKKKGFLDPVKAKERLNAEFANLIKEGIICFLVKITHSTIAYSLANYTEASAEEFLLLIASGPVGQRTKGRR